LCPSGVDLFDQVAASVVVARPDATLGVAQARHASATVVRKVHLAAVGPRVCPQVAVGVVAEVVGAAIGTDMPRDVLRFVAKEPLLALVGMDDPVGVAKDVVVVPGLCAERVGRIGQADVPVPLQPEGEAPVIAPFAHRPGIDAGAVVFEVHAPARAVGISGHEVMAVAVVPGFAVFVLSRDEVAFGVVHIGGKLAHDLTALDLP
jgi:hypothetical protein